jgi:hypothetical protein
MEDQYPVISCEQIKAIWFANGHLHYRLNFDLNNFDLNKFHHSLKEHHKISNIQPKFRCEML